MAASAATKEAIWWRSLLRELGVSTVQPTEVFSDNQGSIALRRILIITRAPSTSTYNTTSYNEHVAKKTITLKWVETSQNAADILH